MNALRTIASLAVTLISVGIIVTVGLAVYPAVNGGLTIDEDIGSPIVKTEGTDLIVGFDKPLTISSKMPYDLTHVRVSAYTNMGEGVEITLMDDKEYEVKTGEAISIPLTFALAPDTAMELTAQALAYNVGTAVGLKVPIIVHVQGYYYNDMFGGLVDVGMDLKLSDTAKVNMTVSEESQIKGTVSNIEERLTEHLPASGTASICGADGTVLDCSFVNNGTSVDIDSKTVDGKGIVEAVKACAEANGGKLMLKVDLSGEDPQELTLEKEDADALIDAITAAVDSTLEESA